MRIDFHYHTILSKKIDFSFEYFTESMLAAQKAGLHGLVMTDHFNSQDFGSIFPALEERLEYRKDYFSVNDSFKVFPGLEVNIAEGPHILFSGSFGEILELRNRLKQNTEPENYLKFEDLLYRKEDLDVIMICAHPFRPKREIDRIPSELQSQFQALDLNGKDLNEYGLEMKDKVEKCAIKLGLPVVGGSDTHHFLQAGCVWSELSGKCNTVSDFRNALSGAGQTAKISPCLDIKVEAASMVKKMMKKELLNV